MFNFFQKNDESKVNVVNVVNVVNDLPPKLSFKVSGETLGGDIVQATIKLKDFIYAVKSEVLVAYGKNRGNGRLNTSKVQSIAANYNPKKLGVITIAELDNGTYKRADAHHRTAAILNKYDGKDGLTTFTEEELEQNVPLHIIKEVDFITVYSGLNANHGHSSRQKSLNTDLGLGALIENVLELQEEDSVVLEKFHTTVARCIYGLIDNDDPKNISYAELSLDRKLVSSQAGLTKEEFDVKLTNAEKEKIADALDYVNKTYFYFKTLNNLSTKGKKVKLNQTARSILRNAGLFGFTLWDKLSGRKRITHMSTKKLAERITEKDAQIEKQAKFILNSESRDLAAQKIEEYINTKKRV